MSDPARPNKFTGLSRLRQPEVVEPPPPVEPAPVVRQSKAKRPVAKPAENKRGNPEFTQVSAYVRKETYRQTKIQLLQRGSAGDFSDLVEALLQAWVDGQVKV